MQKRCFKCGVEKSISEFYRHPQMGDGHLNKCKMCTRYDTKTNISERLQDIEFITSERERGREKYHRLYKGRVKVSAEKKRDIMKRYKDKYPEKNLARVASGSLAPVVAGNELHHWSYNKEHYKDVIELSVSNHKFIHRFLKYDSTAFMYRTIGGKLLSTKELHQQYIDTILSV